MVNYSLSVAVSFLSCDEGPALAPKPPQYNLKPSAAPLVAPTVINPFTPRSDQP